MQNTVFTQLSVPELRQFFRRELENFFNVTRELHQPAKNNKLLTLMEAAKALNYEPEQLRHMAIDNAIPHYRRNKEYYFLQSEIKDFKAA